MCTLSKILRSRLFIIACLFLIFSLVGYSVVAQTDEPGASERDEGQINKLDESFADPLIAAEATVTPLYYFSGVLNQSGSQGTAIMCTNLDPINSTIIEVKLYNYDAVLIDTASISASTYRTVTFESTGISFYTADYGMFSDPVEQGYGVISTEHKNVICTVQVLDSVNDPPTWMESLPVYSLAGCGYYLPLINK